MHIFTVIKHETRRKKLGHMYFPQQGVKIRGHSGSRQKNYQDRVISSTLAKNSSTIQFKDSEFWDCDREDIISFY